MKTCHFIGTGRLGMALAHTLIQFNHINLLGVYNRHVDTSNEAIKTLKAGQVYPSLQALPPADLYVLTAPDDALEAIIHDLNNIGLPKKAIIIHCSGLYASDIFSLLKSSDVFVGCFHPLKAFTKEEIMKDVNPFKNTYCAIEGDEIVLNWLKAVLNDFGSKPFCVHPSKKALYHAAAVMASNYLITLANSAQEIFEQAGISSTMSKPMVEQLMQSSLNHLKSVNHPSKALTGPISRGDIRTLEKHLDTIEDETLSHFYKAAAKSTLCLTTLPDAIKSKIQKLIT